MTLGDTTKLFKWLGLNYCHASRRVVFFLIAVFLCIPFVSHAAPHVPTIVEVAANNQQPAGFSNSPSMADFLNIFKTCLTILQVTLSVIALFTAVLIGLGIFKFFDFQKQKRKLDELITDISKRIEKIKDASADALILTGISFHDRGVTLRADTKGASEAYRKALEKYNQAIELKPDVEKKVWYCKACTYSRLEDTRNALDHLSKAIELDKTLKTKAREDTDFDYLKGDNDFKKLTDL